VVDNSWTPREHVRVPDRTETTALSVLAEELRAVSVRGAYGDLLPGRLPVLLGLRCVLVPADAFAREPVAVLPETLTTVVAGVGGVLGDELAVLLGTEPAWRGVEYSARLDAAYRVRYPQARPGEGGSKDTASYRRRDMYKRMDALAHAVERHEAFFRLRETPNRLDLRVPADTARALAWLDRFHYYYYSIWSAVSGVQNELAVALDQKDDPGTTDDQRHTRARGLLFHAANMCLRIDRFVEERGGAWLASGLRNEQRLGELAWHLPADLPLTALDQSWLVERVLDMPGTVGGAQMPLFHRFWARVDAAREGPDLDDRVRSWVAMCAGPDDGCEAHEWLGQAQEYLDIVDREWEVLTSWFVERPVPTKLTHQAVVEIRRQRTLPGLSEQFLPGADEA
jgi:hypothetical protein